MTVLEQLAVERDRDVARQESSTPCVCRTATRGGTFVTLWSDGCWLHDEAARAHHLRIVACVDCEAEEVAEHLDGGELCRVCAATCIYCHARPASPHHREEPACSRCIAVLDARMASREAGETLAPVECAMCRRWIHAGADDVPNGGHANGCTGAERAPDAVVTPF